MRKVDEMSDEINAENIEEYVAAYAKSGLVVDGLEALGFSPEQAAAAEAFMDAQAKPV
jgi:hypothetical protein